MTDQLDPEADPSGGAFDAVAQLDSDAVVVRRTLAALTPGAGGLGRATSDVRSWLSLAVALPLYGLTLVGARALPPGARRLLLERGWIPHAVMLLSCWALAILLVKAVQLRYQRRAFAMRLLPEGAATIAPSQATEVLEHLEGIRLELRRRRSILIERIVRILEHHRARGDVSETTSVSATDADADADAVASSFSLVKVLVWAIPILGFIGTVIGIGAAVGGFSQSIEGADQLDTIKDSLGDVTSGLAVAFDTTLVALVASILVMLPTSWMQKAEEQLVNDVDDYCVRHVLRRLVNPPASLAAVQASAALREDDLRQMLLELVAAPLTTMLSANQRMFEQWTDRHASAERASADLGAQLAVFAAASRELGPNIERAVDTLGRAVTHAETSTAALSRGSLELTHSADDLARTSAQLCRELGASRQLLQLLAAGLGEPVRNVLQPSSDDGAVSASQGGSNSQGGSTSQGAASRPGAAGSNGTPKNGAARATSAT